MPRERWGRRKQQSEKVQDIRRSAKDVSSPPLYISNRPYSACLPTLHHLAREISVVSIRIHQPQVACSSRAFLDALIMYNYDGIQVLILYGEEGDKLRKKGEQNSARV